MVEGGWRVGLFSLQKFAQRSRKFRVRQDFESLSHAVILQHAKLRCVHPLQRKKVQGEKT
jgi:hypothetical protein